MPVHKIMIPEVSQMPSAKRVGLNSHSWEPYYPPSQDRDYFTLKEVSNMLVKKKVIRRKRSVNWKKEELHVTGVQQVRKWLKKWIKEWREMKEKEPGFNEEEFVPFGWLYKGSYKYGYIIPKKHFLEVFEKMTSNDVFIEVNYQNCLICKGNPEFYEYKVIEIQAKIDKLMPKFAGNSDKSLWNELHDLKSLRGYYQSGWYRETFRDEEYDNEPTIEEIPAGGGPTLDIEKEYLSTENEKLKKEIERLQALVEDPPKKKRAKN